MKVVHCHGVDVSGESDDELDMVGSYSREQILSMAHDH
jgi:hypothetical protein